ncbi:MAG TPA: methylmalonyl-CoA mutase family protein [Dehalococcoidia bacterium]|nr:methylmalonyl-CoA mutase family protein [Dehalococcoidia bacterium]
MFDEKTLADARQGLKEWEAEVIKIAPDLAAKKRLSTISDLLVNPIYTPEDIRDIDFERDIGYPGSFPFTRGCQATGYRGRVWTFRMFSGLGTAEDTNWRWHQLLKEGETGLSTAFDFPTLMGYDSDSPKARAEVGKCGVAIDTLADFEILTKDIPLHEVTTSMTINPPASVLWAMYLVAAEKQGVGCDRVGGTIQNDMLKEFIAQKTFMCPPEPSIRLISDTIEFGTKNVPRWNTISISGYHIREAGATAVQELAFTLADGIAYIQDVIERKKIDVDAFAPRLSFFFDSHMDFFEEIAKFRAARRMWAKIMRERFQAKNPRSWWLRFHTQTAGCSLTHQQPYNNIVRTATEALAAVLGGTQSLHTNSFDEEYALPTEFAATIALRTQQILAEETGVVNTIDPLAGSYFVESLTSRIEDEAWKYIKQIDDMGGMLAAIDRGFPQREIANAAYRFKQQVDNQEKVVVGVNKYLAEEETPIEILKIDEEVEAEQVKRLKEVKRTRDSRMVSQALCNLRDACRSEANVMPCVIEAVRAYATEQEICDIYREVFGEYRDPGFF